MNSCVAAYYPCLVQLMRCFAYFTTEIDTTRYSPLLSTAGQATENCAALGNPERNTAFCDLKLLQRDRYEIFVQQCPECPRVQEQRRGCKC